MKSDKIKNNMISPSYIFLSLVCIFLLLKRALSGIDMNWDSLSYHLPFAARIWEIIPLESFTMRPVFESRYVGFPLFIELLQGFLWKITGSVASANLVGMLVSIYFCYFLSKLLKIKIWFVVVYLFSIPLIVNHAVSCYIDLPANIFIAISLIIVLDVVFFTRNFNSKKLYLAMIFSILASWSKFQMLPYSLILWLVLLFLSYKSSIFSRFSLLSLFGLITVILIMAYPIKNFIQHGNPVYPVSVSVLGKTLPGEAENSAVRQKDGFSLIGYKKYIKSLLEYDLYTDGRTVLYTVGQGFPNREAKSFKLGGLFVGNIFLWFLIIIYCALRKNEKKYWLLLFVILTCFFAVGFTMAAYYMRYALFLPMILLYAQFRFSEDMGKDFKNMLYLIQICIFLVIVRFNTHVYFDSWPKLENSLYKIDTEKDTICLVHDERRVLFLSKNNPDKKIFAVPLVKECPESAYLHIQ